MTYAGIAMLFLVLGLGLLILEFFVPSGGLIGLLCFIAIVISVWGAQKAWYHSAPLYWYTYLAILIATIPGSFFGFIKFLQNSEYGKTVLLRAPRLEEVTPYVEEERELEEMIGRLGEAESELCPSGNCRIDGKRLDCLSDGQLIERGAKVKVIGHRGVYPIVRLLTPDELAEEVNLKPEAEPPAHDTNVAESSHENDDFEDPFADA